MSTPPPLLIGEADFTDIRPPTLGAGLEFLSGVALSTNSRGEQVFSVRGRNERDVAVVLGDFVLRDPWDGRFDMARLPGGAFRAARVLAEGEAISGLGSVLVLEANAVFEPRFELAAGDFGQRRAAVSVGGERRQLFADYLRRDGQPAPDGADLPFSQGDHRTRTNTEEERASVFGQSGWAYRGVELEALLLGSLSTYGVAPEGHLDPEVSRVRYWQIPEDNRWIGGLSASTDRAGWSWQAAGSLHQASRTIKSFSDETYQTLEGEEEGRSLGSSLDLSARRGTERRHVAIAASWNRERHDEQDDQATDRFLRHSYALGVQGAHPLKDKAAVSGGLRWETFETTEAGGRPEGPDLSAWSGNAAWTYNASPAWSFEAALGRLARLPTQRELYGEALGRFLVNQELTEETALTASVTASYASPRWSLSLKPFLEERYDPIVQRVVPDSDGTRRQRINGEDTFAVGVDARFRSHWSEVFVVEGQVSVLSVEGTDSGDPVPEQPERSASVVASYKPSEGPRASVRLQHRGPAFSLNEEGTLTELRSATTVGADLAYRWQLPSRAVELFGRVENVSDAEVLPQLGLPGPGRRFEVGLVISGR